jgi:hypothetical protein
LHYIPPRCCLSSSRDEAEQVIFAAMDDLLAKTGISPGAIDILVTNCSGFTATPTFTDMIVNKYRLRGDIRNVNLSGMGCSYVAQIRRYGYGYGYCDTAIRRFPKNTDTGIRCIYIININNMYKLLILYENKNYHYICETTEYWSTL